MFANDNNATIQTDTNTTIQTATIVDTDNNATATTDTTKVTNDDTEQLVVDNNTTITDETNSSIENITDTNTTSIVEDSNLTITTNDTNKTNETNNAIATLDNNLAITSIDTNETNSTTTKIKPKKEKTYTLFQKMFVNHIAYNFYKEAITLLYDGNYKEAYTKAIKAKDTYDNTNKKEQIIKLPYIPGFIRENAQAPRRLYYKIVKEQPYELKRLIRKIKLLSPPLAMVIIDKTSTYTDIKVTNIGDLPLDKFGIEINYEQVTTFDKIEPNETKTYRYNNSQPIEQITFSEEYGFNPEPIEFAQE